MCIRSKSMHYERIGISRTIRIRKKRKEEIQKTEILIFTLNSIEFIINEQQKLFF